MGLRDMFRSRPAEAVAVVPLFLALEEREWDTEGGDGEHLDGRGYGLRDEHGRALAWDDPVLAAGGTVVLKVAGTSHRLTAIQAEPFAPGSRLTLRP